MRIAVHLESPALLLQALLTGTLWRRLNGVCNLGVQRTARPVHVQPANPAELFEPQAKHLHRLNLLSASKVSSFAFARAVYSLTLPRPFSPSRYWNQLEADRQFISHRRNAGLRVHLSRCSDNFKHDKQDAAAFQQIWSSKHALQTCCSPANSAGPSSPTDAQIYCAYKTTSSGPQK